MRVLVDGAAHDVAPHPVVADEEVLVGAGVQGRELLPSHLHLQPATAWGRGEKRTLELTAKNQYRKLETNIPRKEIEQPQSQFAHSCVCERFLYSHYRSAYSAAGNMWTDPRHMNVEIGTEAAQFPEKKYINGIFVAVLSGCCSIQYSLSGCGR